MFDGRKDETMCLTTTTENTLRGSTKEEHISLIREPGSSTKITSIRKVEKLLMLPLNSVYRFLKQRKSERNVVIIGADGRNVNTGKNRCDWIAEILTRSNTAMGNLSASSQ
jgi:hypothetical protein